MDSMVLGKTLPLTSTFGVSTVWACKCTVCVSVYTVCIACVYRVCIVCVCKLTA